MSSQPRIVAIGRANPPFRYSQREIYEISTRFVPMYRNPRIEQIFMNSDIEYRHLTFDKETFVPNESSDELHARFETHAVRLGKEAIERCLGQSGASATDVDFVVAVTCTGYLCPGLSAIFIKELGMRTSLQRADLVGMGCAGAMPGLQRAYDYVMAYPERKALLVAVEVCSACYYVDESLETVVGNAICADGAAAVLVANHDSPSGPQIVRFETLLEPSYIHTVGFQNREGKLRIVLSKDIRDSAGELVAQMVESLLAHAGLRSSEVDHWIIHSGGRKVIDSIRDALRLSERQLTHSRCVLRNFGNMSSPTVLFVLDETMRASSPKAGELGVMIAMGPGLAIEGALVRW
ncbi:MAG TPA: type III polyketide synthase [Bacteroidota bacterium]|nr:type III polyketide synthase [Bacteroidota bacterium]